jgi:dTDP-4-dehydrorhamnose reductase
MFNKKNILIIGGNSEIGSKLFSVYNETSFNVFTTTRDKYVKDKNNFYFDLENIDLSVFDGIFFEIIFFCASYTSVLECEKNPNKAFLINFENTFKTALYFIQKKSFLIFFSTSQVFNGLNNTELFQNKRNPITIYGKSKALLEEALFPYMLNVCILRCTKIITNSNNLFQNWIINLKSNKVINPFYDIYFSPISINYVLKAVDIIINDKITGLFNISSTSDISYNDAANFISDKMSLNKNLIIPISYKDINNICIPKYTNLESNFYKMHPSPNPMDALDYFILQHL